MAEFDGEDPVALAQSINRFFRDQKTSQGNKAEIPKPEHFDSQDPARRKEARREYAQKLMAKSSNLLTPAEIKFLTHETTEFLRERED